MYRDRDPEIPRLVELMPASGRMLTQLVSRPEQSRVIDAPFPSPWKRSRPIYINFDLLRQLPVPEQDLAVLHAVCWVCQVEWFKPSWDRAIAVGGAIGMAIELSQGDPIGVLAAGGVAAMAGMQIWRNNRQTEVMVEADSIAVRVASRRGYTEAEAANYSISAIERIAQVEGRSGLSLVELLRCQNLRAIVSTVE